MDEKPKIYVEGEHVNIYGSMNGFNCGVVLYMRDLPDLIEKLTTINNDNSNAEIRIKKIKSLRAKTGLGLKAAKEILEKHNWDLEEVLEVTYKYYF